MQSERSFRRLLAQCGERLNKSRNPQDIGLWRIIDGDNHVVDSDDDLTALMDRWHAKAKAKLIAYAKSGGLRRPTA